MKPVAEPVVRIARRCYVPQDRAEDLAVRCAAAVETSGDDTVVASLTAARLHGLWLPLGSEQVHLASAIPGRKSRHMTRTQRPEFVVHRFQLKPEDVVTAHGLELTSIARTWRDLARLMELPDLVAAGDSALRAGTSIEALAAQLRVPPHTPHLKTLRIALSMLDARSRSRPESHLRVAVISPDLPPFEVNEPVFRRTGGWLAEPDLSLASARLALEYQGEEHAKVKRMRKDISRFVDLNREGWLTIPYGPAEVFGRPWEIRTDVRCALRERAPQLLRPRVLRRLTS